MKNKVKKILENKKLMIGVMFMVLGFLILSSFTRADPNDWIIEGDMVYINDSNLFTSAVPHTVTDVRENVTFNLTSYNYEGCINVVWLFEIPWLKPKKAWYYYPHIYEYNTSHETTFYTVINVETTTASCNYGNEYNNYKRSLTLGNQSDNFSTVVCFDSYVNESNVYTIYWYTAHSEERDLIDKTNSFGSRNINFQNFNKAYYVTLGNIVKNKNYMLIAELTAFPNTTSKYAYGMYPCSYGSNVQEAYNDNKLYYIDPWANSTFDYCSDITISNSNIDSDLTDFPAMVKFNVSNFDYGHSQNSGEDLRFFSESCYDGGYQLSHEIEKWNEQGDSFVWVKANLTSASSTVISVYYGNNTPVEDGQDVHGVWDDNFLDVYHITELNATSSTGANNGTGSSGATHSATGKIDGSVDLDGGNNAYIDFGEDIYDFSGTPGTMSCWVKRGTIETEERQFQTIESRVNIQIETDNTIILYINDGSSKTLVGSVANEDQWYHVTVTWDGSYPELFVNGTSQGNTTAGYPITEDATRSTRIGSLWDGYYPNGSVDEARVSNIVRSDAWIKANFYMGEDTEVTIEAEEERGSPPVIDLTTYTQYSPGDNSTFPVNATFEANITEPLGNQLYVYIYLNDTEYNLTDLNVSADKYTFSRFLGVGISNVTWYAVDNESETDIEEFWYGVEDWVLENCTAHTDPIEVGSSENTTVDIGVFHQDNVTSVNFSWYDPADNLEAENSASVLGGNTYDDQHTIGAVTENVGVWNVSIIAYVFNSSFTKSIECNFTAQDTTNPTGSYVTPTPANDSTQTSNSVQVNSSVSDNVEIYNCILDWNDTNETVTVVGGVNCNVTKGTGDGTTYNFTMYVNDTSGNIYALATRYFRENDEPSDPVSLAPTGRQTGNSHNLTWNSSSDVDPGQSITYDYQIEEDTDVFSAPYYNSSTGVSNNYSSAIAFSDGSNYSYRVRAYDSHEYSNWVESWFLENTHPTSPLINITPDNPSEESTLTCNYNTYDDEGDSVTLERFEWYVNGAIQNHNSSTLDAGFSDNDAVKCQVNLTDGYEYADYNSSEVVIGAISVSSETYSTDVIEGYNQTIEIDWLYNPANVHSLLNVTLVWNSTEYNYSLYQDTGTHFIYNVTFSTPEISGALETVTFNWSYVINYTTGNQSATQTTDSHNQNITELTLSNCTWGSVNTVLVYLLRNEADNSALNGSLDISFNATKIGAGTWTYNFSLSGFSNYSICITPGDEEINVTTIDSIYQADGYSPRRHYLTNATMSNTSISTVYLYLMNESDTTKVTFEVLDATGSGVQDAIVMFQRYYEGSNSYRGVAMDKSSTEGTGEVYLDIESKKYRIIIEKANIVLRTYTPTIIACADTPCLQLEVEPTVEETYWEYLGKIAYSCTFTNATRVLRCEIIDTSGVAQTVCLDIDVISVAGAINHYSNCTHCSDVVMSYELPENQTYSYTWDLVYADGEEIQLLSGQIPWSITLIYGATGLVIALMIILGLGGFAIYNPVVSIVFATIGVMFAIITGTLVIGGSAFAGLLISAGILLWRMKS